MRAVFAILLALGCALLAPPALAQTPAAATEPASATSGAAPAAATATPLPVIASIGFYVYEFKQVDVKEQTFLADFYFWIRYTSSDDEFAKYAEQVDFMNGRLEGEKEEVDRQRWGDERYVCWRCLVTFFLRFDLRRYPFDTQRFDMIVEPHVYDTSKLVFRDDGESYAESRLTPPHLRGVRAQGLDSGEFRLLRVERSGGRSQYDTDFGNLRVGNQALPYSRFTQSMVFERNSRPYFYKIIIPLVVVIAVAYLVFLLPPSEIQTSSALGLTSLLTCMAFNVSVGQNLPEVGYLVSSDKFFLSTYVLLFLTLAQSILVFRWDKAGRGALAERWYAGCRTVFPLLYLGSFAVLWIDANFAP